MVLGCLRGKKKKAVNAFSAKFKVHPVKFFEEKERREFNWGLTPIPVF